MQMAAFAAVCASSIPARALWKLLMRDSSSICVASVGASSLPTEGQEDRTNNTPPFKQNTHTEAFSDIHLVTADSLAPQRDNSRR